MSIDSHSFGGPCRVSAGPFAWLVEWRDAKRLFTILERLRLFPIVETFAPSQEQ